MHRKTINEERIDYFFICDNWDGTIEITEPDKCDELLWVDINNLPDNTISYIRVAIDNYKHDISFSLFWVVIFHKYVHYEGVKNDLRTN